MNSYPTSTCGLDIWIWNSKGKNESGAPTDYHQLKQRHTVVPCCSSLLIPAFPSLLSRWVCSAHCSLEGLNLPSNSSYANWATSGEESQQSITDCGSGYSESRSLGINSCGLSYAINFELWRIMRILYVHQDLKQHMARDRKVFGDGKCLEHCCQVWINWGYHRSFFCFVSWLLTPELSIHWRSSDEREIVCSKR